MDSNKKKLPLGIENFEDLIRNDFYYIDKTGLIRDILKQPAKVTLFTRPRRFGKSMAANMLAAYYKRDEDTRALFDKLMISQAQSYKEHLNQYDVISINMQQFLSITNSTDDMKH